MSNLDPNRPEDLAAVEAHFWMDLRLTLEQIFDSHPTVADEYRKRLSVAPPLQRALALHDHPLEVASSLTGKVVTPARLKLYDLLTYEVEAARLHSVDAPEARTVLREILSSSPRDESAPMVKVMAFNKFMTELGYHQLEIAAGVAYFRLERRAWKRPLPKRLDMETLPGLTADREAVYRLDRLLNVLNGLQEYVLRKKPASSLISRIERMKDRLRRQI